MCACVVARTAVCFKLFDCDGDGTLCVQELTQVLALITPQSSTRAEYLQAYFACLLSNRKVSLMEFKVRSSASCRGHSGQCSLPCFPGTMLVCMPCLRARD
jgi:hypothetical protein